MSGTLNGPGSRTPQGVITALDLDRSRRTRTGRRRATRWALRIVVGIVALFIAIYAACLIAMPFLTGGTQASVVINAPVEQVWKYGSNSTRATEWSVYFHHITPIVAPGVPKDGTVGAMRICYRYPDEHGQQWTEKTVAVEPLKHRAIHTYGLKNYPAGFIADRMEYDVDQYYTKIDDTHTRMTFKTRLRRTSGLAGLLLYPIEKASYHATPGASGTKWTFRKNLENISAAVEAHSKHKPYKRPHPWKQHFWFEP
jgi:uncharacterized protein YxeA